MKEHIACPFCKDPKCDFADRYGTEVCVCGHMKVSHQNLGCKDGPCGESIGCGTRCQCMGFKGECVESPKEIVG